MHILIKADDLKLGFREEAWQAFFDALRRRGIVGSVGMIAGPSIEHHRAHPGADRWLASYLDGVEVWNHGYAHYAEEFRGQPTERQAATIRQAQQAIAEILGQAPAAFGAPFNFFDQGTIDACEREGLRLVFATGHATTARLIARDRIFSFETSRFKVRGRQIANPNLLRFRRRFRDLWMRGGVAVLQVHPTRWDRNGVRRFGTVLDTLKAAGCTFLRPTDVLAEAYPDAMTGPAQRPPEGAIAKGSVASMEPD